MTQVGLCATCRNARIIESRRGSRFWMCMLSRVDPRFPKYPPLPVVRCAGYTPGSPTTAPTAPDSGGSSE